MTLGPRKLWKWGHPTIQGARPCKAARFQVAALCFPAGHVNWGSVEGPQVASQALCSPWAASAQQENPLQGGSRIHAACSRFAASHVAGLCPGLPNLASALHPGARPEPGVAAHGHTGLLCPPSSQPADARSGAATGCPRAGDPGIPKCKPQRSSQAPAPAQE